jgi:hypothetical protein
MKSLQDITSSSFLHNSFDEDSVTVNEKEFVSSSEDENDHSPRAMKHRAQKVLLGDDDEEEEEEEEEYDQSKESLSIQIAPSKATNNRNHQQQMGESTKKASSQDEFKASLRAAGLVPIFSAKMPREGSPATNADEKDDDQSIDSHTLEEMNIQQSSRSSAGQSHSNNHNNNQTQAYTNNTNQQINRPSNPPMTVSGSLLGSKYSRPQTFQGNESK